MRKCISCGRDTHYVIAGQCYDCFHKIKDYKEALLTKDRCNDIINEAIDLTELVVPNGAYTASQTKQIAVDHANKIRQIIINKLREL